MMRWKLLEVPTAQKHGSNLEARKASGPKSHLDYWKRRIRKPRYTRGGRRIKSPNWSVAIQFRGETHELSLETPNREVAAARAKEIYLFLHANGWKTTLTKYRPKAAVVLNNATIGEFLARVEQRADLDPGTLADYARALRKIVADIIGASADSRKFGYRGQGHKDWLAKVHAFKLAELTPAKIQKWKREFLADNNADEKAQRHAKVSVNSFLRRARSLFSAKVLRHLEITCNNPFEGVEFEPRQSLRYRSQVNIEELVVAAREQLSKQQPDAFKVFLLAACAGLRRAEIDTLSWKAFRWHEHTIRIEPTRHYRLKTETSAGDVAIDEEVLALFRGYHARAQSEFVIEAHPIERHPRRSTAAYRCQEVFDALSEWLRKKGITDGKPIHALRKEYGSIVNQKYGIFVASRALRHGSVAITDQYYVDARGARPAVGLGHLLAQKK